jgi:DNA-binding transcriptional ArsR family regulator
MVVDTVLRDDEVDALFQALADRTRRDILRRGLLDGESVSSLARHYDMSFAAVQKHVAVLERATLVTKVRRGREQIVHSNAPALARTIALLNRYEQIWAERAGRIADVLESTT